MKKIIVAIDGFSSTGKSTLARQLAKKLHYNYIDSGAMYRAITYYFLQNNISFDNEMMVSNALQNIELDFKNNEIFLNSVCVANEIREMYVSAKVSEVSALSYVRNFAVAQQKKYGIEKGIVMDGRDIGTTVFPQAELKIFMTADPNERANRRFLELKSKNKNISLEEVKVNLAHRDHIDMNREISPLRQAADAKILDNTFLTMNQQLTKAYTWAMEIIIS